MSDVYKFKCGCEIPIVNGTPKINFKNLNLECPKTWQIYKDGQTRSIFQLESFLGKRWSKILKPNSIDDAAALISIIRPGVLETEDETGTSLTEVFCNRKNGKWIEQQTDSVLDILLSPTYGINIYQETSMLIAREVAGFDGVQCMKLIKSIGKKNAELLFSLRKEFIEGCAKVNRVDEKEAESLFSNIEASARYAFNKCILGTEKLKQQSKGSNKFHPTIEELYKITTDINYAKNTGHLSLYKKHKLKKCFGYALSMCEDGRVRKNKIVNIQEAGIRQTITITTITGKTISVTNNHKFPTPNGKIEAAKLKIGDLLYVCDGYEKNNSRAYKFSDYSINEIRQIRKNGGGKVPHGNFQLFSKNKMELKNKNACDLCKNNHQRLEIHHTNGNRSDNKMENLTVLCPSCHKKEEYKVGRIKRGQKGYPVIAEKIFKIETGSTGMTYDITMEAPNHNYVTESNIITCNSHAYGYAETGYWTAWVKAHLPYHYICAWLRNAKNEPKPLEEIKAVISEANRLKIKVAPPSISNIPHTSFFIKNKTVYFGLDSIKGCGEKTVSKIIEKLESVPDSWVDFLIINDKVLNKKELISMVRTGAFDYLGLSRSNLENQYNQFCLLKPSEKKKCLELHKENLYLSIADAIKGLLDCTKNDNRREELLFIIKSCEADFCDAKSNIIAHEKELLGINVSCSNIERSSIPDGIHKAKSIPSVRPNTPLMIVGEISDYTEITIRNGKFAGQLMGTFTITDETGHADCVIFTKELDFYQGAIYDGNIVMIECKKSSRGGIIVSKIFEV